MVTAPAKLTLSLRVSGVRDDGYHLIDAVMVSLALDADPHFRKAVLSEPECIHCDACVPVCPAWPTPSPRWAPP